MAETDASVDESMEGGEQEFVAEADTSQTEGAEEGETDENNTTYNTDVVEEEAPTQVDPDAATIEDIFGADEEEEEEQSKATIEDIIEEDLEEAQYDASPQQIIGSPLRLVTNPLPTPPEESMVVRVKLPNIIGIQSKPFTHQNLEEELSTIYDDEPDEEGRRKKHSIAESQIRWRHVDGEKDVRESNARVITWSDGSMHLMLGNETLDMTMHDLAAEHLYLYARQPGFLHSQGRLNKKVVIRPASLDNKFHQKLSMSLAERNQKISKVKLVTTITDPEQEKAAKEKLEEERIKKAQGETAAKNRIMRQFGLDAAYLEQTGEYDEPPPISQPMRRERHTYYKETRNLADFIVDDVEDDDDDEELEDKRSSKKKRRADTEEDTDRLMNAKRDLSPDPKKKQKEKEKRKVRKGGKDEDEEDKPEETKEEEVEERETISVGEAGIDVGGEEEEEVNMVKRPSKRRGVIVDDDEAE